jgi:hypothetical protein
MTATRHAMISPIIAVELFKVLNNSCKSIKVVMLAAFISFFQLNSGIAKKLPYIIDMGFDAIWISPIVTNTPGGYHGYWLQGFELRFSI